MQSMSQCEPLIPLATLLPSRSTRWIADACRAGRIPGAVKVCREWSITPSSWARYSGAPLPAATVADATETLRAMGLVA